MTKFLRSRPANGVSAGAVTDDYVFAAGIAIDSKTMKRLEEADTIANETKAVLKRLESVLSDADCTLRDVVKLNCYISDEAFRDEFEVACKQVFDPGPYPVRNTFVIGIAGDCRVQVEATAVSSKT